MNSKPGPEEVGSNPASVGKPQMLPSPIAEPEAARMNASLEPQDPPFRHTLPSIESQKYAKPSNMTF